MIALRRYNTITNVPGVQSLDVVELETCEPVGEYCVDTSHFVPRADAVQVLQAGDVVSQQMYDFPDGKATDVPMPSNRKHSYTGDIAEASVAAKDAKTASDKSMAQAHEEFEREQAMDAVKQAYQGTQASAD